MKVMSLPARILSLIIIPDYQGKRREEVRHGRRGLLVYVAGARGPPFTTRRGDPRKKGPRPRPLEERKGFGKSEGAACIQF